MSISVRKTDSGAIAVGGTVDEKQVDALNSISVGPEHILENMDLLNEEIVESHTIDANETTATATPKLPEVSVPQSSSKKNKKNRKKVKTSNQRVPRSVARVGSEEGRAEIAEERRRKNMPTQETTQTQSSLDEELAALEKQLDTLRSTSAAAPTEVEDTNVTDGMREQIMELLKDTEGAPNEALINKWKMEYGANGVHVLALGEGDVYIFTHLKRGQWKKIQEVIAKMQETGTVGADLEDSLKEKVVQHSVLWPRPLTLEFFYNSRAGVMDSLYQVILLNSYFLTPQQAMLLTTQL